MISALAAGIALVALPLPEVPYLWITLVYNLVILAGVIGALWHASGSLCEVCISNMPLNAAERAAKRRPALRLAHALFDDRRKRLVTVVGIITLTAASFFTDTASLADRLRVGVILSWQLTIEASGVMHRKYQPWCPYCDDEGGGWDEEPASSPDPAIPHPA
jgi:hypothetical protein